MDNSDRNADEQESDRSTEDVGPVTDAVFRALAHVRRRRTLALLFDGERLTVEELASLLAGWAVTEEGGIGTPSDRRQILVSLLHTDLPMLDDAGLVEYDPDEGTVHVGAVAPAVERLVRQSVGSTTPTGS